MSASVPADAASSLSAGRAAPASGSASGSASALRAAPVPVPLGWDDTAPEDAGQPPAREFRLRLRRGATAVWVEVFDPDLRLPRIRTAAETDEGGRGLYLVEQLATRWGSRPTPEGKAVWFEMPRSGSQTLRSL
jgi:hypothetical protein